MTGTRPGVAGPQTEARQAKAELGPLWDEFIVAWHSQDAGRIRETRRRIEEEARAQVESRAVKAEEALRRYGWHHTPTSDPNAENPDGCPAIMVPPEGPCECGFEEALEGSSPPSRPPDVTPVERTVWALGVGTGGNPEAGYVVPPRAEPRVDREALTSLKAAKFCPACGHYRHIAKACDFTDGAYYRCGCFDETVDAILAALGDAKDGEGS